MRQLLQNKKARYNYEIIDSFEAGLVLTGTEIKSLRIGKASLSDSYCYFKDDGLYIKGLRIEPYRGEGEPEREKKLLLHKRELNKIQKKLEVKGLTVVATKVYLKGQRAKIEICLARGKKNYDKRNSIKERDIKREQNRYAKES